MYRAIHQVSAKLAFTANLTRYHQRAFYKKFRGGDAEFVGCVADGLLVMRRHTQQYRLLSWQHVLNLTSINRW